MSKKLAILLPILVVVMGAYFGTNVRAGVPHLQATGPPLAGPNRVLQVDYCTWWAVVTGGTSPYSYQWSGIGSGTNSEYTRNGQQSGGTITVTVTDDDETQVVKSKSVTIDPDTEPCLL